MELQGLELTARIQMMNVGLKQAQWYHVIELVEKTTESCEACHTKVDKRTLSLLLVGEGSAKISAVRNTILRPRHWLSCVETNEEDRLGMLYLVLGTMWSV